MNSIDPAARIHDALDAAARAAVPDDERPPLWRAPADPSDERLARTRGFRRLFLPLAAAAAVLIAAGTTATISVLRSGQHAPAAPTAPVVQPPTSTAPTSTAPTSTAPTSTAPTSTAPTSTAPTSTAPTSTAPTSTAPTSTAPTEPPALFQLGYQPLWPFADRAAAADWEQQSRSGGHQPWHLDAGQTALSFTTGYLGFTEITIVTSTRTDADGAHIGVGYRDPNGVAHTAAVLHLVRFGPTSEAPWEVVGSDDTTFSLEQPAYGATISSPVTAGGHLTGVDENIKVSVRQLSSSAPLGQACCRPAGGSNSPWTLPVSFADATDGVVTIVASTGGHLLAVERFAIQAARTLTPPG